MIMESVVVKLILTLLVDVVSGQWTADTYWNSRYSGILNFVDYTSGKL